MFFHSKPVETVATPQTDVDPVEQPVPLSELERDLPAPGVGWAAHLSDRGVQVVLDDLGRAAVARRDARLLFAESREAAALKARMLEAAERAAVEADQQFRAQLGVGVPASALNGVSYAEAVQSMELDSVPYRPRASVVEDLLDNSGMTFHSLAEE
jgi:hypothetical protein